MSTLQYTAIDPERLDAMRRRGADEFGNPWKPRAAEGWSAWGHHRKLATGGQEAAR